MSAAGFHLKSIREVDWVLHERSRLSIVFALHFKEVMSFVELKNLLTMTDGNLSIHLRTLEKKGYVTTNRTREGGKPRKLCRLSGEGRQAFERYLAVLDLLLRAARGLSPGPRLTKP